MLKLPELPPGVATDCSYSEEHRPHHQEHPDGGRIVCVACHPPAAIIRQRQEAANAARTTQ